MLLLRPLDNGWCLCPGRVMHEAQLQQKHKAVSVRGQGGCQPAEQPCSPPLGVWGQKVFVSHPSQRGQSLLESS